MQETFLKYSTNYAPESCNFRMPVGYPSVSGMAASNYWLFDFIRANYPSEK